MYARLIFIWISFFKATWTPTSSKFNHSKLPFWRIEGKLYTLIIKYVPFILWNYLLVTTTSFPPKEGFEYTVVHGCICSCFVLRTWLTYFQCFLSPIQRAHLYKLSSDQHKRDIWCTNYSLPLLLLTAALSIRIAKFAFFSSGGRLHMYHMKKELIKCTLEIQNKVRGDSLAEGLSLNVEHKRTKLF